MRILIIDPKIKTKIAEVIKYADEHVVTKEKVKLSMEGKLFPIGEDAGHTIEIPDGYRVAYSVEEQPIGLCRHISISVNAPGKLPNIAAVNEIIRHFGFKFSFPDPNLRVWIEEKRAVNVVEKSGSY